MNIIVTGSREAKDRHVKTIVHTLQAYDGMGVTLIHGDARGVDRIAGETGKKLDWEVRAYPADWDRHGKAAGPIRNAQMVEDYPDAIILAFPVLGAKNKGTHNMMMTAKRLQMPLKVVELR